MPNETTNFDPQPATPPNQIPEVQPGQPIIINNYENVIYNNVENTTVSNVESPYGYPGAPAPSYSSMKNKWVSLLLCFFLGIFGGHKFYEGKIGMGILYLFTAGLFTIGFLVDFVVLCTKPNPYYV